MQEDGVEPDVITYTSLIKACAIQSGSEALAVATSSAGRGPIAGGGAVDIAESFFHAMQQRTNHFSTYVAPTERTFSRLMQANALAGRHSRVLDLMDLMVSRSIEPSIYSYM